MVKTLILYESLHHGNTKKLVDAIAAEYPVEICDARLFEGDLSKYDLIGFASGIYAWDFGKPVYDKIEKLIGLEGKNCFSLCTSGSASEKYPG